MSDLPLWYKDGLRFTCTGCGRCCTGTPGVVWVTEEEIEAMARFLNLSVETVTKNHVRKLGGRLALMERKVQGEYDCTFLRNKQCLVYPVRPRQCKTFPWWSENLASEESWEEAAKGCEGINHPDAPLISLEEIQRNLD